VSFWNQISILENMDGLAAIHLFPSAAPEKYLPVLEKN
jgi:hypothetical protein